MRWALSGGPTTEASPRASRSTENPALTSPPCSVVTEPDARAVLVLRREDLVRRAASTDGPERQVSFPVSARKYGIRGSCLRRYRFVDGPSRTWTSSAQSHYDRSDRHPLGLVKQAYSALTCQVFPLWTKTQCCAPSRCLLGSTEAGRRGPGTLTPLRPLPARHLAR